MTPTFQLSRSLYPSFRKDGLLEQCFSEKPAPQTVAIVAISAILTKSTLGGDMDGSQVGAPNSFHLK